MSRSIRLTACAFVLSASASLSGCSVQSCIGCFNCLSCLVGGPQISGMLTPNGRAGKTTPLEVALPTAEHAAISY